MKVNTFKKNRWSSGSELVRSFNFRSGLQADKFAILNSVWEKEFGHLARHWVLTGVKNGVLYVKPSSSAAAQELHLRSGEIVRNLNKHFGRAWIRAVKAAVK
jgi:hypothetical protein